MAEVRAFTGRSADASRRDARGIPREESSDGDARQPTLRNRPDAIACRRSRRPVPRWCLMARPRVAFVGSGGAAKGVAHIGVLRAMQELGIEADICVGASAGAIAGAFYAEGYTPEQLIDWFRPFWQRGLESPPLKARYFLGLPNQEQRRSLGYLSSGLFSIDRFEAFVAEQLPSNDFRKLDKHLMVTAADVDGRGRVVFGRGYRDDISISQSGCRLELRARSFPPISHRRSLLHRWGGGSHTEHRPGS